MRNKVLALIIWLSCIFPICVQAQITFGTLPQGPYGQGSSIAVPLIIPADNPQFTSSNVFTLYLSGPNGDFSQEKAIGTYTGFFSTFINGVIPTGTPAGSYQLRVKSSSAAGVYPFVPGSIQVVAEQGPEIAITTGANQVLDENTFGWCGVGVGANKSIIFKDNSAPEVEYLSLKNEQTGEIRKYQPTDGNFSIQGLPESYFTITVTKERTTQGVVITSTRSYLLMNVHANIALDGTGYGCIDPNSSSGAMVSYQVNGISNNYPGSVYKISWGDGTPDDQIIHTDMVKRGGVIDHIYMKSSCGEPAVQTGTGSISNSFSLNAFGINSFCQIQDNPTTKYPKIYTKPIAKISPQTPLSACLNSTLVIANTSTKGDVSDCSIISYEWYIDGLLVSTDKDLTYTFKEKGLHKILLLAKNEIEICAPSEATWEICIQEKPRPAFNFKGNSGAIICTPEKLVPTNTSFIDDACNPVNSYNWTVTGGTVTYDNGTNANSAQPEFIFNNPGIYQVTLSINTASCGAVSTEPQTVIVNGPPVSTLSPDVQLCSLTTYAFDNITTGPTHTTHSGSQQDLPGTYKWTITGGGKFIFTDGTSDTSKYPHITFQDYTTYTVSVTQKNNCASSTAVQKITLIPSPVVNAGPAQTICFEENPKLAATIDGDVTSSTWVGGQGTFTPNRNTLNATYAPTPAERKAGKVELTLMAVTPLADPCHTIEATTTITIRPQINITSSPAAAICSDHPLNYTITSDVPATTFTWTATSSANVTGFQPSGTGNVINDILHNPDPATDATVIYTITPVNGSCTGAAFTLTVTIADIKNSISNSTPIVCSGQDITITGNQPTGGNNIYIYTWESSSDNGTTWTAIPGQTNKDLAMPTTATLMYRRVINSGDCSSISNTVNIAALPPLSGNTISKDQSVCTGHLPDALTGSIPEGGDGSYNYQWQSSVDSGVSWTDITAAVLSGFRPSALTQTTLFRRLVSTTSCSGKLQNVSNPVTITVYENAKAAFNYTADKSCSPFVIDDQNIVAQAFPDRNGTYSWYADNQLIGTGIRFPGYTITDDNKTVDIKLVVTSTFNCSSDSIIHVFSTQQRTTASFTQDIKESCGTTLVTFKNTTPALNGSTYMWDFGNGNTANSETPSPQTYLPSASGKDSIYTVTLTVNSNCGITTFTSTVLIRPNPVSIFSPNKTNGCSPMLVTFSNTSPGDSNTYYYDFGDGTPPVRTTSKTPLQHTYTSGAIKDFVVTMVTENACGRSAPTQYTIRVSPNTILPELVVNSTEKEGCAPLTVNFQNNSSGATSFVYDFGDGTTSGPTHFAPETMQHIFTKGGTYVVKLTASNGCSDTTTTETIVVYNQPDLLFSADVTTGCPGLNVQFKNQSTDAVSYSWDFGDGSAPSSEFEPTHVYAGTQEYYTVKLTAVNSLGCNNTVSKTQFIHIVPPPVARFNVAPAIQIAIPNYTFQFEDESENSPDRWEWDFGDGSTSSLRSPSHTYPDTGSYKVTLRVTNQESCFTTATKTVQITGVPGYLFVPNAFMPNSATPELRIFKAKGSGIASWNMSIFDKWGQLLWQTNKLEDGSPAEGWDGTFKSSLVPQGVYFWKIDVQMTNQIQWKGMSFNGSAPKRTGIINLIR